MSKTDRSQQLLNWLNSEKKKDERELDFGKKKIIREIQSIKKEGMFPKPVKVTLWQRIKVMIWGN